LLHQGENAHKERVIRDLEAQSTAYVDSGHLGLDGLASPNYVSLHRANAEMILEHLERIRIIAVEIISSLEEEDYMK